MINVLSVVGTSETSFGHFLTVINLVSFRNIKKCSQTPKDFVSGHPSVKLQFLVSSQRTDMITCLHPFLITYLIVATLY